MKNLKLNLTRNLILALVLFTSANHSYSQCTFTLSMDDTFGDGWTGGNIDIILDGTTLLSNQTAAGFNTDVTFPVTTGQILSFNFVAGSFPNESSFQILDNNGDLVYSSGPPITVGTTAVGALTCAATCSDGIQNGTETGIDCGGTSCIPCHCTNGVLDGDETSIDFGGSCGTCFDGIQNGTETGIDCGGICLPCNTNSISTPGIACCSNAAAQAIVYPTTCDQIGTSAYNLNSPVVNYTTVGNSNCPPSGTSGCGNYTSNGQWIHLDLADGVDYLQANFQSGSVATGNHNVFATLFQGPDCSNLVEMADCQDFFFFSAGSYVVVEVSWSNLDPNLDVWLYLWDTSTNKEDVFNIQFVGAAMNTNSACPGSPALGEACNLGASGATFNTPGSQGVGCSGGNWGSNENTTFYSFTADSTAATLEISDIICNDGTNGAAQFGVWTNCAAIGTYGADFLGCAVGTASITLNTLVPGQTYYIAADGFAGDNCTWGFTGSGIILPIEMGSFGGFHNTKEVELYWTTITEKNNDYFSIQRTVDGKHFEDIGLIMGAGTTQEIQDYTFIDYAPYDGISYYRIRQTDYDGAYSFSEVISVQNGKEGLTLVKTVNLMGQEVNNNYSGMVIDLFSDGSTVKRMKL